MMPCKVWPDILVQDGALQAPAIFSELLPSSCQQVMIVTDHIVAPLYLDRLRTTLKKIPTLKQIDFIIIQSGDEHKNLETAQTIFTDLIERHHYRDTMLIALGGGMIGDLTGFCAACYLRGVAFIQVPTTLLAQVDAAIGGKVAVNHPLGKNLIGAFYQPNSIVCDPALLDTLPQREWVSGLAEVLKYGLILDADFFAWIESNITAILERNREVMVQVIRRSATFKMSIVSRDERERGCRIFLNFGHTLAHALELTLDFKGLSHGEAVSIGLLAAVFLSQTICQLDSTVLIRLKRLLILIGLPTQIPIHLSADQLMTAMRMDKKNKKDHARWVLLTSLGHPKIVTNIAYEIVHEVLVSLGAQGCTTSIDS